MKYVIRFPQADGWRPAILKGIEIDKVRVVKPDLISRGGFRFVMCEGNISVEDAIIIKLKDSKFKIRKC